MPFYSQEWLATMPVADFGLLTEQQTRIGYHPQTRDELYIPNSDRYMGMYVLGKPGSGKSRLLQNMIIEDIMCERSVIMLDPHADLVANCLHQVSPYSLGKTHLLDMEDEAHPYGLNVYNTGKLNNELAYTQAVERIQHIFEVLWPDVLGQANLPR